MIASGPKPGPIVQPKASAFRDGAAFGAALARAGIESVRLPHRSPNLNAYVERLVQSIEVECLDHFIVLGTRHLDHLLAEYIDYHNRDRPHSSLGYTTPTADRRRSVPGRLWLARSAAGGGSAVC